MMPIGESDVPQCWTIWNGLTPTKYQKLMRLLCNSRTSTSNVTLAGGKTARRRKNENESITENIDGKGRRKKGG
jgi:hypothetical protein